MTTKLALFLTYLRESYFERLDRKTGWGNQEVRFEFEQAINDAFAKMIDQQEDIDGKNKQD